MIDDPDIFRAAKLVIDQQGDEAVMFAAGRADVLLKEGDVDGSAVWRQILAAIEELQRPKAGTVRLYATSVVSKRRIS
jgi:hypothetical protein